MYFLVIASFAKITKRKRNNTTTRSWHTCISIWLNLDCVQEGERGGRVKRNTFEKR